MYQLSEYFTCNLFQKTLFKIQITTNTHNRQFMMDFLFCHNTATVNQFCISNKFVVYLISGPLNKYYKKLQHINTEESSRQRLAIKACEDADYVQNCPSMDIIAADSVRRK